MIKTLFPSRRHYPAADAGLLLDYDSLGAQLAGLAKQYQNNSPYPHIVIDDFLPPAVLDRLLKEYPHDQHSPLWNDASHKDKSSGEYVQLLKRNIRDSLQMPPTYRQLFWELNSHAFLGALAALTGIANLIPDPNLRGAGIHQIGRGGFLKVHADFSTHREFGLDRRLNFLLYLNENWQENWGGHLELWDGEMKGPPRRVLPVVNRCVVFSTTATSFHGHPHPLTCPDGTYRKSLALYYYTNGRPEGEAQPGFSTDWRELPDQKEHDA
ncbi:2OG-Fe(II) oxygenase [Pseudomonas sp. QL9]|uniref:Prolyl 4-hydroxylase alpha subunit Fe(2+) 2OG dioxygenase domain-containing protein n=1 Tax=Pseudomonas knackmussii (strain DSM 6978 / CCUG 54928 / LMG 23759 / B13) TaxID=1301098 RepID=A0A024H9L8_PSEKB|nr:2OG-Fe(II) oxygenase [Pseudomonas knackmussii]CDF81535.1 hypothetical protein PKB_0156 [Pseudomonas knackmussii B13]